MENVERFISSPKHSSPTHKSHPVVSLRNTKPISTGMLSYSSATVSGNIPHSRLDNSICHIGLAEDDSAPLDAFVDKELLAQSPENMLWQTSHTTRRKTRDDIHLTPARSLTASSSPAQLISSPTIHALRHREGHRHRNTSVHINTRPLRSYSPAPTDFSVDSMQQSNGNPPSGATMLGFGDGPHVIQGIPLVQPKSLPNHFRPVFPFETFNAVQSKCFPAAFTTDENLVLSAPTGSGKTVVMELAICRLVASSPQEDFKIVYQAPTKSLCAERCRDWQSKFGSIGLQCAELTGDTNYFQLKSVQNATIIITTPEKWDSVTRKWKDHARLMVLVKLFLIDEIHILKDSRGATLEAVVSRMKSVGSNVRFVALSATVPNSDDVATWLGRNMFSQHIPARREVFGEEFRPVQLRKIVYGYSMKQNDFVFDNILTEKLAEIIVKHSERKPILVFCFTRSSTQQTAKGLAAMFNAAPPTKRPWRSPLKHVQVMNEELRKTTSAGVAFHHAGLDLADRRTIEEGFLNGSISVICCTSTLAVGVNLPCYLVVVKNTVTWTANGIQEYADLEMMQMLGRAGRPQFEKSACAVILTRSERVKFYEKMVSGAEVLESTLHLNLIDHLNAEIGLGTVTDMSSAKRWLAGTFFFVRLRKNRSHYQLKEDVTCRDEEELLEQICAKDIKLLQEADLISTEVPLKCAEFGDVMARYCIKFETMKIILSLPPKARTSEILSVLTQAAEFHEIRFKAGERSMYKDMNKDVGIKFPIKVDVAQPAHKISLLIQSELGGVEVPVHDAYKKHKQSYQQDKNIVFQHVSRLIRCIIDCQLHLKDSVSAKNALELGRSLAARVWDNSPLQLKQIDQIGNIAVRKLAGAGVTSIETLENTEPHRIESLLAKNPPFGMKLLSKVAEFPKLRVSVKQTEKETKRGDHVEVKINVQIGFLNDKIPDSFHKKPIYVCFIAETAEGELLDFRRMIAKKIKNEPEMLISAALKKQTNYIACHVMCDEIAGTSRCAHLKLNHLQTQLFPTIKTTYHDTKTSKGDKAVSRNPMRKANRNQVDPDEFGDENLSDGDFLGVELLDEKIEVVDIDELFDDDTELAKAKGRSAKQNGTTQKNDVSKPIKLGNGRWACNHPCKEKEKCKHSCCKEGLERPPKKKKVPIEDLEASISGDSKGKAKFKKTEVGSKQNQNAGTELVVTRPIRAEEGNKSTGNYESAVTISTKGLHDHNDLFNIDDEVWAEDIQHDQLKEVEANHDINTKVSVAGPEKEGRGIPRGHQTGRDEAPVTNVEVEVDGLEDLFLFPNQAIDEMDERALNSEFLEGRRSIAESFLDQDADLGFFDIPAAYVAPQKLRKLSLPEKPRVSENTNPLEQPNMGSMVAEEAPVSWNIRYSSNDIAKKCEFYDSATTEGDALCNVEMPPRKKLRLAAEEAAGDQESHFEAHKNLKQDDNEAYEETQCKRWEEVGLDRAFFEEFKDIVELI